jgi:hypothetical protein
MVIDHQNGWQAELTIGTMVGYDGPEVVTPARVIELVASHDRTGFAACVWTRGTMLYHDIRETVIKVSVYNPNASYLELSDFSVALASFLAGELDQERVYVNIVEVATIVVGRS